MRWWRGLVRLAVVVSVLWIGAVVANGIRGAIVDRGAYEAAMVRAIEEAKRRPIWPGTTRERTQDSQQSPASRVRDTRWGCGEVAVFGAFAILPPALLFALLLVGRWIARGIFKAVFLLPTPSAIRAEGARSD